MSFKNFRLLTVPEDRIHLEEPTIGGTWGTAVVWVRGYCSLREGLKVRVTATKGATIGGTSHDFQMDWTIKDLDGNLMRSGFHMVGREYTPGTFLGLAFGLVVAYSGGTTGATNAWYEYEVWPWRSFGPEREELDFTKDAYSAGSGVHPFFRIEEEKRDFETEGIDGRAIVIPRTIRRNVRVELDGLLLEYRRTLVRWAEEKRRLAVCPFWNHSFRLLLPFQDSVEPFIGPPMLAGWVPAGDPNTHRQTASGEWEKMPIATLGPFVNMEGIGRAHARVRPKALALSHSNAWTPPTSPISSSNWGWTVPSATNGNEIDFDGNIRLPIADDPGAIRWRKGTDAQTLYKTVAIGTPNINVTISFFARGRSKTDSVTLTPTPTTAGVPQNTLDVTLSETWTRYFIVARTDGSGNVRIDISMNEGDIIFVCGAQIDVHLFDGYRGPDPYQSLLTGDEPDRGVLDLVTKEMSILGDEGHIFFFWRPGVLGCVDLVRRNYAFGDSTFGIYVKDKDSTHTVLEFVAVYNSLNTILEVSNFDENTVFLVSFYWARGFFPDETIVLLFIYSDDYPTGHSEVDFHSSMIFLESEIAITDSLITQMGVGDVSYFAYADGAVPNGDMLALWTIVNDPDYRDTWLTFFGREYVVELGPQDVASPEKVNASILLREVAVNNAMAIVKSESSFVR